MTERNRRGARAGKGGRRRGQPSRRTAGRQRLQPPPTGKECTTRIRDFIEAIEDCPAKAVALALADNLLHVLGMLYEFKVYQMLDIQDLLYHLQRGVLTRTRGGTARLPERNCW